MTSATLRRFLALAVAALALTLASFARADADASPVRLRRFALLIGANHGGEGRVQLRYAVSDARAMARVLQTMGGVAPDDLVFLAEPDRAALLDAFDRMDALVRASAATGVRRELLVYYSGHSDEEGLLVQGQRLGYEDLRTRLQAVPVDVRLAILDSCASGAFTRRKGGVHRPPFLMDASADMRGSAILTSSSATEVAQESDRVGGSFFTHFLVSGLRGAADVNTDRRVTLQEAFQFASQETLARTERTRGGPQHAAYEFDLAGTGELVVTDVRSTQAALVLAPELAGRIGVRDARGDLVAELRKGAGHPVELGLEPGVYVVTMDGDGALFEARANLASGARTQLARLAFHAVSGLEAGVARGGAEPELTVPAATATGQLTGGAPERLALHAAVAGLEPRRVDVHGLALGLVAERAARVHGLELALGMVQTDEELHGLQWALGAAVARGRTRGVQLGTFANVADGDFHGVQVASLVSVVRGSGHGLQLAGVLNYSAGTFHGAQIGTVNLGEHTTGLALGAVNVGGSMQGLQLAAVNLAEQSGGLQLGAVNVAGETAGLQVGAVNVARHARGFQLGVINVVDEHDGEAFGVLTFARNGIHDVRLYTSDTMASNLAVQLGTRHLYTSLALGFHPGSEADQSGPVRLTRGTRRFGAGFGVGWRVPIADSRFEMIELEASGMNVVSKLGDDDNPPIVAALRLQTALRLLPHLALFGGPSLNVAVGWSQRDADLGFGVLERVQRSGEGTVRIYPGFVAGVQM
jgi:hypothetical protein